MAFSDNLQLIRRKHNLTQEELADRLGVSRQTVSKWESGACFPEMDKILTLCDLYGCSLEGLMRGDLADEAAFSAQKNAAPPPEERVSDERILAEVDRHFTRFALAIGTGVFLILLGVAACVFWDTVSSGEGAFPVGAVLLLSLIAAAVVLFILSGFRHTAFLNEYPEAPVYPAERKKSFEKKFAAAVAGGVALIFGGIVMIVAASGQSDTTVTRFAALFLLLIGVAVFLLVFSGILHSRFSPKEYGGKAAKTEEETEADRKSLAAAERKISVFSSVLFLTATAVFLLLGFLGDYWHPAWVIFPICGLITAIFSVIVKGGKDE